MKLRIVAVTPLKLSYGDWNGFKARAAIRAAARDPRIECIEGEGMEEGRLFLHLEPGYGFDLNGNGPPFRTKSVGNRAEVMRALASIVTVPTTSTKGSK